VFRPNVCKKSDMADGRQFSSAIRWLPTWLDGGQGNFGVFTEACHPCLPDEGGLIYDCSD